MVAAREKKPRKRIARTAPYRIDAPAPVTGHVRIAKLEIEIEGDAAEVREKIVDLFGALKDALGRGRR